ncbi:DnaJ domain-containing protein [Hoeflea sp.]|uniref:DnaJ domain-containing protein n=1 Tax=Hoeflea sp. TaxID=1940281 RepID=UPI00374A33DF
MRNPYTVLGVTQTASIDEIKSAFRQLAKFWHPDQKPDDPRAGVKFAEIAQAYKLLVDPDLRVKFDKGEVDARGRRRPKPARGFKANPFSKSRKARSTKNETDRAEEDPTTRRDEAGFEDMVVHIFGEAAARNGRSDDRDTNAKSERRRADAPGLDEDPLAALDELFAKWKTRHHSETSNEAMPVTYHQIDIALESALDGYRGEIGFGDVHSVSFTSPPGTLDGTEIRVPSPDPDAFGDAVVTLRHAQHPKLRAVGADLHGEHAISLSEAVLGGSFVFTSLDGPVRVTIPEWSGSDTVLRVPGKGLPSSEGKRAPLHIHLRVMLPEKPDSRLVDLMRSNRRSWFM